VRDVSGLPFISTTASVRCDHLQNRRSVNLGDIDSNDRDGNRSDEIKFSWHPDQGLLTMRLSDAGVRQRKTKLFYPNHRPSPWSTEAASRDRSSRMLEVRVMPPTGTDLPACVV